MTTRAQRESYAERERAHRAERYRDWLAGLLVGSIRAITDDSTELEVHATEHEGYLPSFTVRRGGVGVVVHVEPEIVAPLG
jgi:hypothetical protein